MKRYCYEIYLAANGLKSEQWQDFFGKLVRLNGWRGGWQMEVKIESGEIRFYLGSDIKLPISNGIDGIILRPCERKIAFEHHQIVSKLYLARHSGNLIDIIQKMSCQKRFFETSYIDFWICGTTYFSMIHLVFLGKSGKRCTRVLYGSPVTLLAVDFTKYPQYLVKRSPKYLKMGRTLQLLSEKADDALLKVENFPYAETERFLNLESYSFERHSLILGGSGTGKSKFVALLMSRILEKYSQQYKIVMIDPHDAMKEDFATDARCKVTDFSSVAQSVNLFMGYGEEIPVNIELLLSIFASLMAMNYNSYVERVLRFAMYVLLQKQQFSLMSLRRLLTETAYRHQLLEMQREVLPDNVVQFFLSEYNTLRTQKYDVAIAPIITFVDEMQMVPVFNAENIMTTLLGCIQQSGLNIFSLNRVKMGTRVVKMIAGLLMQQLFVITQKKLVAQHLLIVIDEVAVIENPILARFLSELRKYHASVILIGQYFGQLSQNLQAAIYANMANYYVFRVSNDDAVNLQEHLKLKVQLGDNVMAPAELLTELKLRECVGKISAGDTMYPAFKARTLDFTPYVSPKTKQEQLLEQTFTMPVTKVSYVASDAGIKFSWQGAEKVDMIMRSVTTRRKPWNQDNVEKEKKEEYVKN